MEVSPGKTMEGKKRETKVPWYSRAGSCVGILVEEGRVEKKPLEGFAEGKNLSLLEARDLDTCTLSVKSYTVS